MITVFPHGYWLMQKKNGKRYDSFCIYYSIDIISVVIQVYRFEERLVRSGAAPPGKVGPIFSGSRVLVSRTYKHDGNYNNNNNNNHDDNDDRYEWADETGFTYTLFVRPPRNPFLDIHRESMGTVYGYTHGTTLYYY